MSKKNIIKNVIENYYEKMSFKKNVKIAGQNCHENITDKS